MPRHPLAGPARSADAPITLGPWTAVADRSDHPSLDIERQVEDWLVCHLEDRDPTREPHDLLADPLARGGGHRSKDREPNWSPARGRSSGSGADWSRLRHARVRGVSLVRFPDSRLLREDALRTVADELLALVRAGHHRIVLNFEGVTRMSSQILGVLAQIHRLCAESDGGQLRLCGLRPELVQLFQLTGLAGSIALFDDERDALEKSWPKFDGPRPLPVSVLTALTGLDSGGRAMDGSPVVEPSSVDPSIPKPPRLRLVALSRKAAGRAIAVETNPFVIGRDRSSRLRADVAAVSRSHAAIEVVDGGWVVRDLGSTNGTFLNGQLFRGLARPLANGDEIRIGPIRFTVLLGDGPAPELVAEDLVASWLRDEADPMGIEPETRLDLAMAANEPAETLKVAVIEGVLVLTPRLTDLEAEQALEDLRSGLTAALAGPSARQVVINLEFVGAISSRTIGLLMATFLRLDRQGGRLRLCQPSAPVRALLERIRVPMLVPVFATLDEAVLNVWS